MSKAVDTLRDSHADFNRNHQPIDFLDPMEGFNRWFDEAVTGKHIEPNAMTLSTVNAHGIPSARVVYLKALTEGTFVFYTNYLSQKGKDLMGNPHASLLFFWPALERQIRITGTVAHINPEESDAYFASRPRESQLGAWASQQSEALGSEEELLARFEVYDQQFPDEVPRPPHWGGMALTPDYMEFWQGKPSRLHERLCFERVEKGWERSRKNP
ncbi:MAG: pyridoxamine 5'-phosphate oxidase [Flavobacteriales bacterium]